MVTYLEPQLEEASDGTFKLRITISAGFNSEWTTPTMTLRATTLDEAREEALEQLRALKRGISDG